VRIKDVSTRHVNVHAGRRDTWKPPACGDCERLRVWVYGGSTTFGLGQRDEHTIPSVLARAAWEDGVVLDVENRGVGGDTHWEAAQRFAWDVTRDLAPDMVVFYDGTNEIMATRFSVDPATAPSVIPAELWQEYLEQVGEDVDTPPGAVATGDDPPPSTAEEVGHVVAQRYERSRTLSRAIAERSGAQPVWVWQPAAERHVPSGEDVAVEGRDWALRRLDAAQELLGDDVVDLSTVFDDFDAVLFYDQIHTNEVGAELVGRELYSRVRPQIRALAGGQGRTQAGGPS
jgi:lysophospholipase L1-like esterase